MDGHIDRMEEELIQLGEREKSLTSFIFNNEKFDALGRREQVLMIQQVGLMAQYCRILNERISRARGYSGFRL